MHISSNLPCFGKSKSAAKSSMLTPRANISAALVNFRSCKTSVAKYLGSPSTALEVPLKIS